MSDSLGDRMKMYEGFETNRIFMPGLPICVRVDGRGFSGFTKNLNRPFDYGMVQLMQYVTKMLVEETNARIGYTQSDEISLIIHTEQNSQPFFGGKVFKLTSQIAALATVYFNQKLPEFLPSKVGSLPTFDCRAWTVPNKEEAVNTLIWREWDATKNAITMAASCYYSHKELLDKNSSEKQELLHQKGLNFNDMPVYFKRGSYFQRKTTWRKFTTAELEKLPLNHNARKDPDLAVQRRDVALVNMPILSKIANRIDVVFDGAEPVLYE